ncbi:homeobox protein 14 isoform X1 [Fagus crenata]
MEENPNRAEAERLLGIAEKLLQSRDLTGSRDFAILAQETEPLLDGSDQILAVTDVLLAAEKRINNHHDWYSILQLDRRSDDLELIKKQYRRLALLLHPDKNKFPLADQAFKLVADAWAVLNDNAKKTLYDNELSLYSKVDLTAALQAKLPVRRSMRPSSSSGGGGNSSSSNKKDQRQSNNNSNFYQEDQRLRLSSFWTMCPYCYNLYEYPRVYENCCLRCQNCQRAFHAAVIPSLPPLVPGQDAYYCCWGFFPMGFVIGNSDNVGKSGNPAATAYPNWMPPMFPPTSSQPPPQQDIGRNGGAAEVVAAPAPVPTPVAEKRQVVRENLNGKRSSEMGTGQKRSRGRPRKYPVQS